MKVSDLIRQLQQFPEDSEVYYGAWEGFLSDNLQLVKITKQTDITEKEAHVLYPVGCEFKTVYCWSIKQQKFIPYTGVIIETDG